MDSVRNSNGRLLGSPKHPQNRPAVTSAFRKTQLLWKEVREEFCRCGREFVEQLTGKSCPEVVFVTPQPVRASKAQRRDPAGDVRQGQGRAPRARLLLLSLDPPHTFPDSPASGSSWCRHPRSTGPRARLGHWMGLRCPLSCSLRAAGAAKRPAPLPGTPPSQLGSEGCCPKPETPFHVQLNTKEDVPVGKGTLDRGNPGDHAVSGIREPSLPFWAHEKPGRAGRPGSTAQDCPSSRQVSQGQDHFLPSSSQVPGPRLRPGSRGGTRPDRPLCAPAPTGPGQGWAQENHSFLGQLLANGAAPPGQPWA